MTYFTIASYRAYHPCAWRNFMDTDLANVLYKMCFGKLIFYYKDAPNCPDLIPARASCEHRRRNHAHCVDA